MAEEKFAKSQSQRKRRHDRDTCINNLKLNLSSTKADYIRSIKATRDLCWSNKNPEKHKDKYARGSLDNISHVPWDDESTLRRTRSFAISRESLFYSLDYTENHKRRSQLIPRARLIEKSFIKDSRYESFHQETTYQRKISYRPPEISPDYSPLPSTDRFPSTDDILPEYRSRCSTPLQPEESEAKEEIISTDCETKESETSKRRSFEDSVGLSLPHYYPESELTDNFSITDNQSTFSQDKYRYISLDNIPWSIAEQPESISYDENIVLAKRADSLYAKPKTIRGPTPYHHFYDKLPHFKEKKLKSPVNTDPPSSIEFETNTNCDEIKLNNENICKEPVNDIIGKLEKSGSGVNLTSNTNKVEDYKSIVTIDNNGQAEIVHSIEEEAKNHSHNYLKEFLETQKGCKKPLQSFIAKKFSNLTRRSSKSNLVSNQFYSLPDITASKNLHKCERIDKKLRKCDKLNKPVTQQNRFIVNIGNHFDITAKSNIPVDFQVKIAKVPKKKKQSSKTTDQEFKDAVKNINATLQTNGFCIDFNNNSQDYKLEVQASPQDMDPEIQEKVDNMKKYWTKMSGQDNEKGDEEKPETNKEVIEIHTKINEVKRKFEPAEHVINEEKPPSIVKTTKQLFEPKPLQEKQEKISPNIKETCSYFEPKPVRTQTCYESLCPSSVDIVSQCQFLDKPKKPVTKANSISIPEFDHVRYKVIKPELFNKTILANSETDSQFDGLMQYLQDYSFQELLIDNNIVIIEPIRSKVTHQTSTKNKTSKQDTVPVINQEGEFDDVKQGIRKHFFYHPIRVNKEVNDAELPNPEVVRQARQFFEKTVTKSQSNDELGCIKEQRDGSVDLDKDKCSTGSTHSTLSDQDQDNEIMYDSLDNECCTEYVSEDIMEKIREYGTSVTYYGGKVVDQKPDKNILTKVIMEEIKDNEKRCMECSSCRRRSIDKTLSEVSNEYQGIKFKLVKSNSCNSRLELVGAAKARKKVINNRRNSNSKLIIEENNCIDEAKEKNKNKINENIKLSSQPRIIGEEMKAYPDPDNKYIQWSELKNDQTYASINYNEKSSAKIKNYDYQHKVTTKKRNSDMDFEPYEVA